MVVVQPPPQEPQTRYIDQIAAGIGGVAVDWLVGCNPRHLYHVK